MLRPAPSAFALLAVVAGMTLLVPCPSADAASERQVSRVLIKKDAHVLQLLSSASGREEVVRSYKVAIGPGGAGPKLREGDQVTPVGRYHVTMHQPSTYRVFLRLDYPNAEDYRRFASLKASGVLPKHAKIGGDIGIHGPPVTLPDERKSSLKEHDWTLGCIAVDDDEIADIARRVRDGTPVDIED